MNEDAARILYSHLNVNDTKPVSYLPIKTVNNVLDMSLEKYVDAAHSKGLRTLSFDESESCIKSGAIYVYDDSALNAVLIQYKDILSRNAWPSEAEGFIRRIARDWLDQEHPILPVVRRVFGDPP